MRRVVRFVLVLIVAGGATFGLSGCGPVKVNAFTCEGSMAQPHESHGSPGWMLAKARAKCYGTGRIRYIEIKTQMQQKVGGRWITRNTNLDRLNYPKLKKYYTAYTNSMRCQRGTYRARVKLSGRLVGGKTIVVEDGGWLYSNVVKNPCG